MGSRFPLAAGDSLAEEVKVGNIHSGFVREGLVGIGMPIGQPDITLG